MTKYSKESITELLKLEDFSEIYLTANRIRSENVGEEIHLRAIIEFSNVCRRECLYCGLNCQNHELNRYRMTADEILTAAEAALREGYRTIVLQSGEDPWYTKEYIGELIREIKKLTYSQRCPSCRTVAAMSPAVTLSLGEREFGDYAYWREKGADRYLLKHETADPILYNKLHPDTLSSNGPDCNKSAGLAGRIEHLRELKSLGYETGSGFMVGLPGQSIEDLADNLLLLKELECDMAGIGPFIYNPKTPIAEAFGGMKDAEDAAAMEAAFDSQEMTKRCIAIARILLPKINLPATTAARVLGAKVSEIQNYGANVIMNKFTPDKYKTQYEIYPSI